MRQFVDDEFKIPVFIKNNIHNYLEKVFRDYRERVSQIFLSDNYIDKEVKNKLNILDEVIVAVLDSINDYNNGYLARSYGRIENILNKYSKDLVIRLLMIEKGDYFFRGRIANKKLIPKEQFHIPFSMRRLASSYRYSVLGLPCLYLGKSIQVCWEELKRPNIREFQVSVFRAKKDIQVYDLSKTLEDLMIFIKRHMSILLPPLFFELKSKQHKTYIAQKGEKYFLSKLPKSWTPCDLKTSVNIINDKTIDSFLKEEKISVFQFIDEIIKLLYINAKYLRKLYISDFVNYVKIIANSIILHPLKMACSIIVEENKGIYKPEYIISQHIMQWIRANYKKQDIMGIKYLSTKLVSGPNMNYNDRELYINYAFPVFEVDTTAEYCNVLSSLFSVSKSICFDELDVESIVQNKEVDAMQAKIYSESPCGNKYSNSYFYYMEKTLKNDAELFDV